MSIGIDRKSIKHRALQFWKRNQIIIVHFPITMLALFGCNILLRALDPRIGVEGFGDLFGYLLNAVRATIIIYTAWWMKKWLFFDLTDDDELDLYRRARSGERDAHILRWTDRGEWALCLALATFWLTR